ncbi:MAG: hypothetical protein M4579_001163 [Chaenotheca gracillima]|nr:MAG: hypothetical protein M4579_001163 [Chaenotheca gracillima]
MYSQSILPFLLAIWPAFTSAAPAEAMGKRTASGLNADAKAIGKVYFGSATDNGELNDTAYTEILGNTDEFGQTTPTNSMKWDAIEPSRNNFTFAGGDQIAELAKKNNQLLRCHNLLQMWHKLTKDAIIVSSGNFDNETLISIMENHITNEVKHFGDACYAWDVVNEALEDNGTYRADVFYNTIGPAYIPLAFKFAQAANPNVKLYYNDYNIEYPGPKALMAQEIVAGIQAAGARIDGVGLQSHFIVGETPSLEDQMAVQKNFSDLGVDIALTELDIRLTLPSTDDTLAQQKVDYNTTVSACVQTPRCIGVTIWDYTDKYSWIPNTFPGQGDACPWDANLQKTPAYDGIVAALT